MIELLAPCGDINRLKTALHFGADAVYVGGNSFGLRAGAKNFSNEGLVEAVEYVHSKGKKIYVTCNIVAHNTDFIGLREYLAYLEKIKVDAVIVADPGVIVIAREILINTEIHLSTQANATNKYAAKFWAEQGCSRIVLARELSITEIKEIRDYLPDNIELEAFVHGAMCISHSGRCLLSNFLTKRDGNRGACVQACRWEYEIHEVNRPNSPLVMSEDSQGTYLMNSKDLNMIEYIKELADAGVTSFKVEGRMKSQYYVGTVINAYRQAINGYLDDSEYKADKELKNELLKTSHRDYTTGFYFGEYDSVSLTTTQTTGDYDFMAEVIGYDYEKMGLIVEQRNRFCVGDTLEILSRNPSILNKTIVVDNMYDTKGETVTDAKLVQQILIISSNIVLEKHDILRKRVK